MKIQTLVFSPFQVNTYIISDPTGECVIIDPACYFPEEQKRLTDYISSKGLKPVRFLLTHCHLDHVFGSAFVQNTYRLDPNAHRDEVSNNNNATHAAQLYGVEMKEPAPVNSFIDENTTIRFGNSELKVFHIPGHTAGSLVYYNEDEQFAIVGDVLFDGSIGRTDLPGGNYDALISGIKEKLFNLHNNTKVYPGHGQATTIGKEKSSNPFLK
jgi:glyoxylase-like metal-dependent hydrolase (beta-lactamase superfamily II)